MTMIEAEILRHFFKAGFLKNNGEAGEKKPVSR